MNRYKTILLFHFLFLAICERAAAQLLPPFQPEQDACNALVICEQGFRSPYSYVGIGRKSDITVTPCGPGETNVVWLRLNISTAGSIVFRLIPEDPADDYDFAVMDITGGSCASLTAASVVRCNFNNNNPNSNVNGVIGLNTVSTLTTVAAGVFGNSYCSQIMANAGDVYLIMINNFGNYSTGGPSSGFSIDFSGSTAGFSPPSAPALGQVVSGCNYRSMVIALTNPALCGSIAPDGTDFALSPQGNIVSAQGVNCSSAAGYTQFVELRFSGPLVNGAYQLHARQGSDGNTLIGLCGTELAVPDALSFNVSVSPPRFVQVDSPACREVVLSWDRVVWCDSIAADGSDFVIEGPSPVTVISAAGSQCATGSVGGITRKVALTLSRSIAVDGVYTVRVVQGSDGNPIVDTCGVYQQPEDTISFTVNSFNGVLQALPDTVVCSPGDIVQLRSINNGTPPAGGFVYTWSPAEHVQQPGLPATAGTVYADTSTFLLETIDAGGCYLRDSNTVSVAEKSESSITPEEASICPGTSIRIHATGGMRYVWSEAIPGNPEKPVTLSCSTCPDPQASPPDSGMQYYVMITNEWGCRDTLTAKIHVFDAPQVRIHPGDTTLVYGTGIRLTAEGAQAYQWYPWTGLDNPTAAETFATVYGDIVYTVTGRDENGCADTAAITLKVDYRIKDFIPDAFTPNGDGLNDVFKVAGVSFQSVETQIYNRWGQLVYNASDNRGWNGTMNGQPADAGTYHYVITIRYPDGFSRLNKGTVLLVR